MYSAFWMTLGLSVSDTPENQWRSPR